MKLIPGPPPEGFVDSIATTYSNVAAQREEMGEAEWRWPIAERVLRQLLAERKTRLLEIGAGVGFTSRWFADRGLDVLATDLSEAQVELIRAKGVEARVASFYDLGVDPESFDAAWAMNCIHHIPSADLVAVMADVSDALRRGGLWYLGVWGGRDEEGMYEDDFYQPARFLALRSDESMRAAARQVFEIEWFETFLPDREDDPDLHMQSMLLRKP
jgi:SAM-dependent methyltransferase